jgi:hypothetical protein
MFKCSIKPSYDEIIIIIHFLLFTSKLNTQKQNTKLAKAFRNMAAYIAIILIKIKNNNDINSIKYQ